MFDALYIVIFLFEYTCVKTQTRKWTSISHGSGLS